MHGFGVHIWHHACMYVSQGICVIGRAACLRMCVQRACVCACSVLAHVRAACLRMCLLCGCACVCCVVMYVCAVCVCCVVVYVFAV